MYLVGFFTLIINFFELVYVFVFNKPVFVHAYIIKKRLPKKKKDFLVTSVTFYQNLDDKYQSFFEHRVAKFIRTYDFIPRNNIEITPEMKVLIASSYVKLTFGMRRYLTKIFNKIIIYPEAYYSLITQQYHKGEFNPALKAIIFSWEDFLMGDIIQNDNINLGIHEFTHAMTFHGSKLKDVSARIFYKKYKDILNYLSQKQNKEKVVTSNYFREYANTNNLEFIAVVLECFFETPLELKENFPELYKKVITMLNYRDIIKQLF